MGLQTAIIYDLLEGRWRQQKMNPHDNKKALEAKHTSKQKNVHVSSLLLMNPS